MQSDDRFHTTELGGFGSDDEVTRKRDFQATSDAHAMNAGDDRRRVLAECTQQLKEQLSPVLSQAVLDGFQIGARGKVAHGAVENDGARSLPARPSKRVDDRARQREIEEVVGRVLHREDRHRALHLRADNRIGGFGMRVRLDGRSAIGCCSFHGMLSIAEARTQNGRRGQSAMDIARRPNR